MRCTSIFALVLLAGCATSRPATAPAAAVPVTPPPVEAPVSATLEIPEAPPEAPPPAVGIVEPPSPPIARRAPFVLPELPKDPAAASRAFRAGVRALKQGKVPEALEQLGACVASNPDRHDCKWQLGWALYVDARWLEARRYWREVAARRPNDREVTRALALVNAQADVLERLDAAEAVPPPPLLRPPEGTQLRLRAVGDVMLGTSVPAGLLPPEDGKRSLEAVQPLLEDADLTFANLEGPLCDSGESSKCRKGSRSCYAFRSPVRYGDHLVAAGVDVVSIANNHVGDFGDVCRAETQAALDARELAWSGPPGTIATVTRNGLRIALIAFHTSPFTNYLLDLETAQRLVQLAARTHHVVAISFHGGAEGASKQHVPQGTEYFFGENRGDLRRFTHAVVDAGADVVLGHGPHVLRGIEVYRDRLIAYSLGNFATYGPFTLSGPQGIGAVLEVVLAADGRFVSGKVFPTRQVGEGIPEPDPDRRALDLVRTLSREDFPDTGVEVDAEGTLRAKMPAVSDSTGNLPGCPASEQCV